MNCVEALKLTEEQFVAYADYCLSVFRYNTPVDTGKLRDSEKKDRVDDKTFVISATATRQDAEGKSFYYPRAVNDGRGWVYPKNKKALYWEGLPHPVPWAKPAKPVHFLEKTISMLKGGA